MACQAPRGFSWPFFLSAAWHFVVLKPRTKGHRKLLALILDRHVDGLGRPHQHLHHNDTAAVTGQAIQGSGNTYGWVMVRAVRGVSMGKCSQMTDRPRVRCTVLRRYAGVQTKNNTALKKLKGLYWWVTTCIGKEMKYNHPSLRIIRCQNLIYKYKDFYIPGKLSWRQSFSVRSQKCAVHVTM